MYNQPRGWCSSTMFLEAAGDHKAYKCSYGNPENIT
jgi:hypothetical protein